MKKLWTVLFVFLSRVILTPCRAGDTCINKLYHIVQLILISYVLCFSAVTMAQTGLQEINVPLDQFVLHSNGVYYYGPPNAPLAALIAPNGQQWPCIGQGGNVVMMGGTKPTFAKNSINITLESNVCSGYFQNESFSISGPDGVVRTTFASVTRRTTPYYDSQFGEDRLECGFFGVIEKGTTATINTSGTSLSCSLFGPPATADIVINKIMILVPFIDLSIWSISIPGVNDPNDGLPIVTVGVPVQINVPVSGPFRKLTPDELSTFVPVTLHVGSQTLTQNISMADLAANQNNMTVPFMVTFQENDIGLKTLIATVNAGNTLEESNLTNNEFRQNVHVRGKDCNVSDKTRRKVPFFSQDDWRWKDKSYAYGPRQINPTSKQISDNRLTIVGCVTTSIAMVFDYLGINTLTNQLTDYSRLINGIEPIRMGTLIDPEFLNELFKGVTDINSTHVEAYDSSNDVVYENAAHAARASSQIECYRNAETNFMNFLVKKQTYKKNCIEQSMSKISYRQTDRWDRNNEIRKKAAFKEIEKEICAGKPVLLRVEREAPEIDSNGVVTTKYKGHTVVAIASEHISADKITFRVHDPSRDRIEVQNITLEEMAIRKPSLAPQYKYVVGYDVYKSEADPSMISVTSSDNIQFILTDNLGRRTGFNPTTSTKYEEIPGAVYSYEGIAPNLEDGDIEVPENYPSSYRLFLSNDVQSGSYQLTVFGTSTGEAQITISKTDINGFNTDTEKHNFIVVQGSQNIINFKHSTEPLLIASADLKINYAHYEHNTAKIYGELKLPEDQKITCSDTFKFNIGALTDLNQTVSLALFNKKNFQNTIFYEYETSNYKITLSETGIFWLDLKNIDLQNINQENRGKITVGINDQVGRLKLNINCHNNICNGESN